MSKHDARKPAPPPGRKPDGGEFGFVGFHVVRQLFQELPKTAVAEGETLPTNAPVEVNVNVAFGVNDRRAEVRLRTSVGTDHRKKPYQIEVEVVGRFEMRRGSEEELVKFCKINAPAILFPYVREIIHRMTVDGQYGVIRLDPVFLNQAIDQDNWTMTDKPASVPTAPAQPSSQSPDASKG